MSKHTTRRSRSAATTAESDLAFDHATEDSPVGAQQPARATDQRSLPAAEDIHATQCVINSECTLTPHCRGRLRQTSAINGLVQVYCPKCSRFAAGTRPLNGLVQTSDRKLFDRVAGK